MRKLFLGAFLILPSFGIAQVAKEEQKNKVIHELTVGCASSLIAPSFKSFMEHSKSAGISFPNEAAAKKAFEQMVAEKLKSDQIKNQAIPAAIKTCQCTLESTFSKIRTAKTQLEIETVIKGLKPDLELGKQCAEKHLKAVLIKGNGK